MPRPIKVPVPATRDPFVNTPLLPAGRDADGNERFWISSWNAASGTLAALVTPAGTYRRFPFPPRFPGFYSAIPENNDTLWLCGWLNEVVRLDLTTGKHRAFGTGASPALVFQGMAFDKKSGKLFAGAFPVPEQQGFVFSTRTRKPAALFRNEWPDNYMRFALPGGDGTWTFVFTTPGVSLVRWDPRHDTVRVRRLQDTLDAHSPAAPYRVVSDTAGRWYFSGHGWLNPRTGKFGAGPVPEKEATWFARRGTTAYGGIREGETMDVYAWDLAGGAVRHLGAIPEGSPFSTAVTAAGDLISVSIYGVLRLYDGRTGALKLNRVLSADRAGRTDCVVRIDRHRLLGTPFITQRFWETDIRTGKGIDCGKAAPGGGEILRTWKLGRTVYMAAYTGSELVAYDPGRPARFPENPHVVAKPPHGMRPVSDADDGRTIFYSSSAPYGTLGSTVTAYDTRTGLARYAVNPLKDQQIRSLACDRSSRQLVFGTSMLADCASCPPSTDVCYAGLMDPETLRVKQKIKAPSGAQEARVLGPAGRGRYVVQLMIHGGGWLVIDINDLKDMRKDAITVFPPQTKIVTYAGRSGRFLILNGDRLELWALPRNVKIAEIGRFKGIHKLQVQDRSIYAIRDRDILIFENVL